MEKVGYKVAERIGVVIYSEEVALGEREAETPRCFCS